MVVQRLGALVPVSPGAAPPCFYFHANSDYLIKSVTRLPAAAAGAGRAGRDTAADEGTSII